MDASRQMHAAGGIAAAVIAGGLVIASGIGCPFRGATGLLCPLCGTTRASRSLLAGDLAAAWAYNPGAVMAVAVLPLFAALWLSRQPTTAAVRDIVRRCLPGLLVAATLFMITRNMA